MKKIRGQAGQSIFDIALQAYGDAEGVGVLLRDNTNLINNVDPNGVTMVVGGSILNQRNVNEIFSIRNPISN